MRLLSGTTLIITNCTLQFDAGVSIICEPGSYMQVVNATLTNSTTTAWRGIRLIGNPVNTFGSGATCELHGATIRNSYTGIEAAMGSTVSSVYSLFDANVVGIELGTGGIWNAISFTIAETRFTSSTNLIAQCSTLPIQGLTKPLAGIIAKNIGTLDMTPFVSPSTVAFDNLNNGIVSTRGNCIVNNCKFEEIRNYDMHSFNYKGWSLRKWGFK
ncbi:MAG: hypothetical protein IPO27_00670 [Bacteroidetes bacterium]|nr:hypothetical protein [Bacteroidota bacterium]